MTKRPNIILILADDHGHWAMRCAGNSEIQTPNLDRLAASGIRFENFFCVTPVCSAARAAILTGSLASQHGVHDFIRGGADVERHESEFLAGKMGYTDLLAQAGYTCGISGKWHLGADEKPQKSYEYWRIKTGGYMDCSFFNEQGEAIPSKSYSSDKITDYAVEFLEKQKSQTPPFCLTVTYNAPHSPWERKHHHPQIFDEYHEKCGFKSIPNEPKHQNDAGITDFFTTPERRKEKLSGYFAAVTGMDRCVGRLLDWLEKNNLRENTLIVYTSDNGMNMGHHGICGKGNGTMPINLYDTSVKVPGIISCPGLIPQNKISHELLSHYDLMPTFLEVAGVKNPNAKKLPGSSMARLWKKGGSKKEESIVVFDEYGPNRMIRTQEWKYVHRHSKFPCELYDLKNDPGERTNLIDCPEHVERITQMKTDLEKWFSKYADPKYDGSKLPVTGCGQLDLADKPNAFSQAWPEEWLLKNHPAGGFKK